MRRRDCIGAIAGAAAWPFRARGQPANNNYAHARRREPKSRAAPIHLLSVRQARPIAVRLSWPRLSQTVAVKRIYQLVYFPSQRAHVGFGVPLLCRENGD